MKKFKVNTTFAGINGNLHIIETETGNVTIYDMAIIKEIKTINDSFVIYFKRGSGHRQSLFAKKYHVLDITLN